MTASNNILFNNSRHQPWELLGDIDNFVNNLISGTRQSTDLHNDDSRESNYTPPMDVSETETAYRVCVELAGVSTDDIDVTINDAVLTVTATRKDAYDSATDGKAIRRERRYGEFSRSLKLAEDVLEDSVSARYENGVLTLELPKAEQRRPRKIEIVSG